MAVPFKLAFSAFILSTALVACPAGAPQDITPPTITGHTPGVNAANVSARDPISVTFSKAIKASSINGDSVLLVGAGSVPISNIASLSSDGRTLSVMPVSPPVVPNTLTLALTAAVTDTTGNALAPASWSWTLPDWLMVGGALNAVSGHGAGRPFLALDAAGKPVVSFGEYDGTSSSVYTWRWTGADWQALGGALNPVSGQNVHLEGLVVDASDHPVVSFTESDGAHYNLYVQRWDGSAWQALGSPINPVAGQDVSDFSGLALLNGNPVTVIQEFDGANYNAYVQAWTGSAWQTLGAPINLVAGQDVSSVKIAVNPAGAVAVAVQESDGTHSNAYVSRWDGSTWQPVGGALNALSGHSADSPLIALDATGSPVVAFEENNGVQFDTYAYHWTGGSWIGLGASLPSGSGGSGPSGIAVDGAGNVVVAAFMYGSSLDSGRVQRWNGSAWQAVGSNIVGPGGSNALPTGLVLDPVTGAPIIAYRAKQDGLDNAFVTRYNQ